MNRRYRGFLQDWSAYLLERDRIARWNTHCDASKFARASAMRAAKLTGARTIIKLYHWWLIVVSGRPNYISSRARPCDEYCRAMYIMCFTYIRSSVFHYAAIGKIKYWIVTNIRRWGKSSYERHGHLEWLYHKLDIASNDLPYNSNSNFYVLYFGRISIERVFITLVSGT